MLEDKLKKGFGEIDEKAALLASSHVEYEKF